MLEKQNIEWKTSWRDEYLKWICGFANANGGNLFIGKDDHGNVLGLSDYKKLLNDIPNKIQNRLGIVCDVNLHEQNGKRYIEIVVKPQKMPISYQGKFHYRSGSTKQELNGATLNEFLLKKVGETWEEILEYNASYNEILNEAVEEFKNEAIKSRRYPLVENETNIEKIFTNLRLLKDKTIEILEKKYFKKVISYDGLNRIETTEYPYEAVKEALLNAIIHKNYFGPPIQISIYDDKFIIWNPGKLPDELKLEDFKKKHASYPRNPIIADVLFKAGLIETWGRGTLKIIEECKKAGLPDPKFEEINGGIAVSLFKDKFSEHWLLQQNLNKRQIKAVCYTKENEFITNSIYQKICETSERTALRDLEQLIDKQIFNKTGEKKGTKYKLNYGG